MKPLFIFFPHDFINGKNLWLGLGVFGGGFTVHNIILKIWTTVRGLLFFVTVHNINHVIIYYFIKCIFLFVCSEAFLLFYFSVQNWIWRFLALGCSFNSNIVPEFLCLFFCCLNFNNWRGKRTVFIYMLVFYVYQLLLHA